MWYWHKKYDSDVNLDGKTIVITGANSGIGKETAKKLYKRGARVLILCRDQQKAKLAIEDIKADTKQIHILHDVILKKIDLSDFSSIRTCAQEIEEEEMNIHVLINNAGMLCDPDPSIKDDVHFRANHLGHCLLTMLLLPKLVKTGSARVVNVSSNSHNCPIYGGATNYQNYQAPAHRMRNVQNYCESKTAQMLFTKELARRLKDIGVEEVRVVSCHPGYTGSPISRNLDIVYMGARWFYDYILSWFFLTPEQAADTVEYCAVQPDIQSGEYYSYCVQSKPNSFIENEKAAKKLWDESFKQLNMEDFDLNTLLNKTK